MSQQIGRGIGEQRQQGMHGRSIVVVTHRGHIGNLTHRIGFKPKIHGLKQQRWQSCRDRKPCEACQEGGGQGYPPIR
jgi:hypothetical protein